MTDKKWNTEEYKEVKKLQQQNQWSGMKDAYESQKKDYEECTDRVQKARYLRGLKILERSLNEK